jgi:hypothetical protein
MSTSDIIFFQSGNPITWQASKQKVVALSSCEAEYVVVTAVACQAVWLVCLLADMVGTKCGVPELKVDNQSAITLCKNHVFHDRSKHINIRYHFIQECFVSQLHGDQGDGANPASGVGCQGWSSEYQ